MIEHECTQANTINQLNNAVFNGGDGLLAKTSDIQARIVTLEKLENTLFEIKTDLRVLLVFQTQIETKESERRNHEKKEQWIIGTLIALLGLCVSLLGYIIL